MTKPFFSHEIPNYGKHARYKTAHLIVKPNTKSEQDSDEICALSPLVLNQRCTGLVLMF